MHHAFASSPSIRCGQRPAAPRLHRRRVVQCAAAPEPDAERPSSSKGKSFSGERRRRGRPAHLRSPDDSPLRDGNRDRLMGLLTERAAKTLAYYLIETNHNVHHWLNRFIEDHPVPRDGNWDDVSGDTFLRTLMARPIEEATPWGRDPVFHNTSGCDVDPRSIAQRIMEIRTQLAAEFISELKQVAEENKLLQLEALQACLLSTEDAIADGSAAARQAATLPSSSSDSASSPLDRSRSSMSSSSGNGSCSEDDVTDASRVKHTTRLSRKSVLPPQPAPSNWRLRLEVEAQVYGSGGGGDDAASSSLPGVPPSATGIPDSVMTRLISPTYVPPTPAAAPPPSSPPPAAAPAAAAPPSPPPLHPEVAELLPQIRASPAALTPDVAQMLSSHAVQSNGQLHPDIVEALRSAVAAGAKLHPEIAELLRVDSTTQEAMAAAAAVPLEAVVQKVDAAATPAAAPVSGSVGGTGDGVGAVDARSTGTGGVRPSSAPGGAPLEQPFEPLVVPLAATAAADANAVAAAVAVEAPEGVTAEAKKQKEDGGREEEDSLTTLQNDRCLHSDEE